MLREYVDTVDSTIFVTSFGVTLADCTFTHSLLTALAWHRDFLRKRHARHWVALRDSRCIFVPPQQSPLLLFVVAANGFNRDFWKGADVFRKKDVQIGSTGQSRNFTELVSGLSPRDWMRMNRRVGLDSQSTIDLLSSPLSPPVWHTIVL